MSHISCRLLPRSKLLPNLYDLWMLNCTSETHLSTIIIENYFNQTKIEKKLKNKQEKKSPFVHIIICLFIYSFIFSLVGLMFISYIYFLVTHKYVDLENYLHTYVGRMKESSSISGCVSLMMLMLI